MTNQTVASPVIIGGVGGSGTRLIAEMLREVGYYLGSDLNRTLDNLWVTLLLKRPELVRAIDGRERITAALGILEKAMAGRAKWTRSERRLIVAAAVSMAISGHDHLGAGRGMWALKRGLTLFRSAEAEASGFRGWGWKEPNSQLFLEPIFRHFPTMKYIHVMRHGLDMAFSENQAQLYNWGFLYGVPHPSSREAIPAASLKYWIRSNRQLITEGRALLGENFLQIDIDALCANPRAHIRKLLDFLGVELPALDYERLCNLPRTPLTSGRYQQYSLDVFDPEDLEAVVEMGYQIV